MPSIQVGDVVVHNEPNGPVLTGRMLFYVNEFNSGESDMIALTKVTSNPNLNWQLRLPADQLIVVGHIEGKLELHSYGCFRPEDMIKFEPARQEALRRGVSLNDEWTR